MQFIKHKKKLLLIFLVVASCLIFLNFQALPASAKWYDAFLPGKDDAEKALKFLNRYADKLIYSDNPMKSMLHTVGWFLVECCYKLSYFFETSLDGASLLSLFSFVDGKDAKIHGIYSGVMTGVVWGLLVLTLCFCGYKLILGKSNDLKNLGVNICLSVVLLVLMPTLFGTGKISGESFARALYNDAKDINTSGKSKGESLSFSLIRENCTDWIYVSQNSKWGDIDKGKQVNALSETKFKRGTYPLSNLITSKAAADLDTDDGKYLQYHLSQDDHDDTKAIKSTSLMSWAPKAFQSGYYQYTLTSTFGVLIGLLALVVAFAFNAFVIIRTVIELAFKRVIAPVVFATDVETLQKSKMVLTDIMKGYLTIGLTELSMVIFQFWITFVNTKNMNLMLKVIAYCAGVWVLIVGSTSVLRYFDVDIGLQQGKQGLGAGLAVGAAIGKGGKSVKSAIGNATGSAVAGIAGGVSGIVSGLQKGAGMKLSQSPAAGSAGGNTNGSPNQSHESLSDQQRQQDDKQQNGINIQARRPSLARRTARNVGSKIQSAANHQMEKHPGAAKLGSAAGAVAGGSAGLAVRSGKKLSGMDQRTGSQQTGGATVKNASQARSGATSLSQKPLEQQEEAQQQEQEFPQEPLEQAVQQAETPQASQQTASRQQGTVTPAGTHDDYSQIINGGSSTTTTTTTGMTRNPTTTATTGSQPSVQQTTEVTQPQAQEAVEQQAEVRQEQEPQEAVQAEVTQPQTQEYRQAETLKGVTQVQTEAPRTEAGTHDYSQIIQSTTTTTGGSPVTMGSQTQSVQPQVQAVQKPETTTTTTVQKQKRPETPPTKPDDNVLNNPWGNVDNDRSR